MTREHLTADCYLTVQRFVFSHELIEENLEGVDPNFHWRLPPVPLLLPHGLFQDVLKQSIQVFVADTFPIIHLWSNRFTVETFAFCSNQSERVFPNIAEELTASAVE